MEEVDGETDPQVRFGFAHDLDAPRRARQAIGSMFADVHDPVSEDVRLVASELVSNVILHTRDGGEVRAYDPRPCGPVRLEVEDTDRSRPAVASRSSAATSGRGLQIVDDVCRRWGVDGLPAGKVVWAEFG